MRLFLKIPMASMVASVARSFATPVATFMAAFLVAGVTIPVMAQSVYKWVDEDGNIHYSQALPPEQVRQAHERLSPDGLVVERVERVHTEQERAELEALEREQAEESERRRFQAQQDRLFLAAYPTEQHLRRVNSASRETLESERRSLVAVIDQTRVRFSAGIEQAAAYERRGEDVPEFLEQQVADARNRLAELNQQLGKIDQRLEDLDAELTTNLERHRQLSNPG